MVKIHKNDYTLKELVELDQDDHYTVSETPLGAEEGKVTRYVKKAVDWTGVDGDGAFSGDAEAKERLRRRLPAATFAALKKLAQNSKANSGSRGTVLVRYPDGVKRVMSYKNWKAIEDAGLDGKKYQKDSGFVKMPSAMEEYTSELSPSAEEIEAAKRAKETLTGGKAKPKAEAV